MGKIVAIVSIVIAIALFGAGAMWGIQREKRNNSLRLAEEARKEAEAYAQRTKTDAKIRDLSEYALCARVARVPDECEPLRGLDTSPEGK